MIIFGAQKFSDTDNEHQVLNNQNLHVESQIIFKMHN